MEYPKLRLKKGREKSAENFHPWIFSGAIEGDIEADNGEIVSVGTSNGRVIGHGFYDSKSQISCRLFHFGEEVLDFGEKTYWKQKFDTSFQLRLNTVIFEDNNCYRLVNAEGDGVPGLIIDIYKDTAVIQFLIMGMFVLKEIIFENLHKLGFVKIYVKNDPVNTQGYWESGSGDSIIEVLEYGLHFVVDVVQGQKTGFFIDQRENRRIASKLSKERRVLNLFSYTGGFAVSAFHGQASKVVSVDVSASALKLCKHNVELNFPDATHEMVQQDCFQYLREMDGLFDMIIIDPPAFAKNRSSVNKAARGYKDLTMIAIKKIATPGIILTFSCSQHISKDLFQKIIFAAASDAGRQVKILKRLEQPEDHPVNIYHPEGDYLKGLLLWVE